MAFDGYASPTELEVLVAEDSPTQGEQLRALLQARGYTVRLASNGRLALDLARAHKPAFIISDIVMPAMDGYQLCRSIKADLTLQDTPVILVTSLNGAQDVIKGLECGADGFIRKPYEEKNLLSRLEYLRANRMMRQGDQGQMGLVIVLGGQKHFITSERQQILDLLISTYETAVQKNDELIKTQQDLQALNERLEEMVQLRTAALLDEIEERRRAEAEVHLLNAELEQRVAQRTTQLEAANRELEAFSYSVSHDLRAPLRTINGFSQTILDDYAARLDADGQHLLQRIIAAAHTMGELIDGLLALARVARAELRRETVDLGALAQSILPELQRSQPERAVEVHIAPDLLVTGDARLLRIVLVNLLGNAWKFTAKTTGARIELSSLPAQPGPRVFFVRDNGAGFDQAYAGKLFGAFQRMHPASEFEGTGIGLATVQRIIHQHGGRVWAEGVVQAGAVFYFTLSAD